MSGPEFTSEEFAAWMKVSQKLSRDLARLDALRSGRLTFRDGGIFLDNGEQVTKEILESLGWKTLAALSPGEEAAE